MSRAVILALLLLMGGCSSDSATVEITSDRRFEPSTITIDVGDSVDWVNESGEPHTITAYQRSVPDPKNYFASGEFESEKEARANVAKGLIVDTSEVSMSFFVNFNEPGTYEYFCIPHEDQNMKGTVVVEG